MWTTIWHSNNKKKTLFAHSEIYVQRDNIECEMRYYWQRRKILPEVFGCSPFAHEILKSYRGIIFPLFLFFILFLFYLSTSLIEMHHSRGPKKLNHKLIQIKLNHKEIRTKWLHDNQYHEFLLLLTQEMLTITSEKNIIDTGKIILEWSLLHGHTLSRRFEFLQ